jgi:hypothetical protein
LELILEKLELFDVTSKKCNVCKKYLQTPPQSKTFSGHPCQRILREHLYLATKLKIQAKKDVRRAVGTSRYPALKAKFDAAVKVG